MKFERTDSFEIEKDKMNYNKTGEVKINLPIVLITGAILLVLAIVFLGYFIAPDDYHAVIAMGIGAIMFVTVFVCISVALVKIIAAKNSKDQKTDCNSSIILYEAYKRIFK